GSGIHRARDLDVAPPRVTFSIDSPRAPGTESPPMAVPPRWLALCVLTLCAVAGRSHALPLIKFDFDEGSGNSAVNSGTLGNASAGVINGPTYTSDTPFGTGTALSFDGVKDFVRVPTSFSYGGQFTIEAWVKPHAVDGQRVIWDDYGNPGVLLTIF